MTSRILLIPCCHFNREGELVLRACYMVWGKYPRKIMIVTPPTIGASSLLLASFGVNPVNYVAVNGCGLRCVDKILKSECNEDPGASCVYADSPSKDPLSALEITDEEVEVFARRLEQMLGLTSPG